MRVVPLNPNELTSARRGAFSAPKGACFVTGMTIGFRNQSNCGLEFGEVQVGRDPLVPEREDGLDQSGHARGRLEVPEVRLHRADDERAPAGFGRAPASPQAPTARSDRRAGFPVPCAST